MKGSLYLIGGGEIRNGETIEIDDELKDLVPRGATFVFFATAAGDDKNYINAMKSVFGDYFTFVAPTEKDGPEFAHSAIQEASIIYLGGGKTELLLKLFKDWGLVEVLQKKLERGGHLVGMSAGAQALCAWYIYEEGAVQELREGWGFYPACILVHAKENSFETAKKFWQQEQRGRGRVLGVGEGAAWRVAPSSEKRVGVGTVWQD